MVYVAQARRWPRPRCGACRSCPASASPWPRGTSRWGPSGELWLVESWSRDHAAPLWLVTNINLWLVSPGQTPGCHNGGSASGPGSLDMLFEEGKGNEIAVTLYNTFPLTFPLQMSLWSSSWRLFLNLAPFSEERVLLITHSQNSTERWTMILFHARNSRLSFVFVWFMICGKSLTLKCVLGLAWHKVLWVWIKISWQWSWQQATIFQCRGS